MAARTELAKRQRARTSVLDFATYTWPAFVIGPHHQVLADKLDAVERGEIKRLMVAMPPRHGKSEVVSKRFPAWFLGRNPDRQIISASYGADLAMDFGRDVRNIVASDGFRALFPGVGLAEDSAAKNRWHTNGGGGYVAAGVGTAIMGRGAHILNIDDPVQDRAQADSETVRNSVWNWYTSTAYTRLMPGGAVVLTMTRWHPDDLAGRLLQEQESGGDRWDVLSMPAINDVDEALWPDRYDRETLRAIEAAIGPRDWSALYQQNPTPAEGALFRVEKITVVDAIPANARYVRAWDLAATAQTGTRDPDWTVGVKLARHGDAFTVADVVRVRGGPDDVEKAIVATATQDGRGCRISLPQDPGQAGKSQVLYLTRKLMGYTVESSPETGDKATRAAPVASQANIGNLSLMVAAWNRPFLGELRDFPSGTKDDQVDALSRAFNVLATKAGPLIISDAVLRRSAMPARRF